LPQTQHLGRDDAQARLLEAAVDLANQVLLDTVGLDDGQGTLNGHYCYSPAVASYVEAFTAPALAFHVRVTELEGLVQALLDEIDLGAVDQLEALAVHDDLHAAVVEDDVAGVDLVRVID